ncbi:MAG: hypothetical protein ACYC63_02425 [Armatimonadota bacterium]
MRHSLNRSLILLAILLVTPVLAQPPKAQTRPWRIGITGGYSTGYLGLMALHGFPRERIDDDEILSLEKLRRYDMIIIGVRGGGGVQAMQTLEQYVHGGGIALCETVPAPSTTVIPGRRVGPAPTPNMRFVDSGTPISKGLPELGVIGCAAIQGMSITPDASSGATVLARFTDEQAPKKLQGKFVENGQGLPAIVMVNHGKGKLIYSGAAISYSLSLRGRQFEPFLVNLLNYVSDGQLSDRMYSGTVERSQLVTVTPQQAPQVVYATPAGAAQAPPADYETLEEPAGLADFAVTGKLDPKTDMRLLISYWSPQSFRELLISKGKATLVRCSGGKSAAITSAAVPAGAKELLVVRRHGLVTAKVDGKLLLCAADGLPVQGALAVKGLTEPSYQPLDQVGFADDFMRETVSDEWEQVAGKWQLEATEGKPEMGANPFNYRVTTPDTALAVTGNWFWSDYAYEAAVTATGQAAGIIANYQDKDNYLLLRLQPGPQAKLQLIRRTRGEQKILSEMPVVAATADWHRLGLRTSHGVILAQMDGRTRLRSYQADQPLGQIGLYCEKGEGNFDDVRVWPWVAGANSGDSRQLTTLQGEWRNTATAGVIRGSGSGGARVLAPWDGGGDCQASVNVNLGGAAAAGLHLRYVNPDKYCLLALMADGGKLKIRAYRHDKPGAILAEKTISGPSNQWHKLSALVQDCRITAFVDDKPVLNLLDAGHLSGSVGLYARGQHPALFRDFSAMQIDDDQRQVDELTPNFAGIIDRHTWAGRSGAWVPDAADLNTFWHSGYFPGAVQLQAGLHPTSDASNRTVIHLSPGHNKQGYNLVADRTWSTDSVPVTLTRAGQTVAQGKARVEPGKAYSVGLFRNGAQLKVDVNGKPTLLYTDPQPLPKLDSLGLNNQGRALYADDLTVTSPEVYDYTFEAAPTDWTIESGTWDVTSRWSCTPGWAWFSGYNQSGYATILTKQAYEGDQDVVAYVAAKMMPVGDKKYSEKLTDIYMGMMVGEKSADTGYQFVIGGMNNTWTALRRNGVQVTGSSFRLSQAGMHNDWLKVTLRRRGGHLECWVWNTLVLQYDDPQPLTSGRLAIGTYQNGILVPRVTIFGKQAPDE